MTTIADTKQRKTKKNKHNPNKSPYYTYLPKPSMLDIIHFLDVFPWTLPNFKIDSTLLHCRTYSIIQSNISILPRGFGVVLIVDNNCFC